MSNITHLISKVRDKNPLIHNITNQVVVNFTANGLLALGASPVMANAREEAADMARVADALMLNIGTLTSPQIEGMLEAGKAANEKGIPVVFDPVGVGATPWRNEVAAKILNEVRISAIRGNAGEIGSLAGINTRMKGVDSTFDGNNKEIAVEAARQLGVPVILTGEEDIITDGVRLYVGKNGDSILTRVTGAGCLLSSVIAAFLAVGQDTIDAAAGAISFYGIAAEVAAAEANGPGSFQPKFLDALYQLQPGQIEAKIRLEQGE